MSILLKVVVSSHLIFAAISQSQCEDNPSATRCESDTKYCYNACVYPSVHDSSQTTVSLTYSSYAETWFPVTFSPLIRDCVGPKITFQFQETDYYQSYEKISIYDSNYNAIKTCGTLYTCGWTDCLTAYSLYDNLGVSEIKAGSNYTFHIYNRADCCSGCSGLYMNAYLTMSCFKVPSSDRDELIVDQPFRCSYLTENIALFYHLNYIECVNWKCFAEFGSSCRMINYLGNTNPTRCYLFDKQCVMQSSEDSGDVVTFAIDAQTDFCVDSPYQWTDSWSDTCDQYQYLLNLCADGRKTEIETVEYFQSHIHDGFTALDACCECGGGLRVVEEVIITFDSLSKFNDGNVLCSTNYDTISTMHIGKNWDNIMLYKLCTRLYDTVWWMLSTYTLDCTMFLESSIDNSLTFSIFICDFDGYVESSYDPYFLFGISMVNSTSTSMFVNDLWFDIVAYLLPSAPFNVSYTECFSMLSNINSSNSFLAVPCDQYIASPTSSPTLKPTALPTTNPTNPTVNPTLSPTLRPTKVPTPPTLPTAPTLPTINPTPHPTLRPTKMPTKYPTLVPTKMPTPPTLPTAPTLPTMNPTSHPTTTANDSSTQPTETTMVQKVLVTEESTAVGVEKTTINVIFISFLSTLMLVFWLSYLWKHKIKARSSSVEISLTEHQTENEKLDEFEKM